MKARLLRAEVKLQEWRDKEVKQYERHLLKQTIQRGNTSDALEKIRADFLPSAMRQCAGGAPKRNARRHLPTHSPCISHRHEYLWK